MTLNDAIVQTQTTHFYSTEAGIALPYNLYAVVRGYFDQNARTFPEMNYGLYYVGTGRCWGTGFLFIQRPEQTEVAFVFTLGAVATGGTPMPVSHTDNGRRIFLHGTTSGGRVVENSHGMAGVWCAMCHGSDGRGGMMHGIPSPDITYSALTDSKGHEHEFMN